MKITGLPVLNLAMRRHADARKAIERWMAEAAQASWKSFQDVKSTYGKLMPRSSMEVES